MRIGTVTRLPLGLQPQVGEAAKLGHPRNSMEHGFMGIHSGCRQSASHSIFAPELFGMRTCHLRRSGVLRSLVLRLPTVPKTIQERTPSIKINYDSHMVMVVRAVDARMHLQFAGRFTVKSRDERRSTSVTQHCRTFVDAFQDISKRHSRRIDDVMRYRATHVLVSHKSSEFRSVDKF
jgi:hypothetical protein